FLCDLDQNLLTFTQQIRDCWLMSFAPRLSTKRTLITLSTLLALIPALVSSRALIWLRCRRRRSYLFHRLNKLHRLKIFVLAVCCFYLILSLCSLRLVLGGASAAAPTATSCKFTARLSFAHARFRVGVIGDWLSICISTRAFLRRLL